MKFSQEREFSRDSPILTLAFTYHFRDFRESTGRQSRDGIEGDIDGLD